MGAIILAVVILVIVIACCIYASNHKKESESMDDVPSENVSAKATQPRDAKGRFVKKTDSQ